MNGTNGHASEPLISGLAHVNLTIPRGTLDQAFDFYGNILGLTSGKLEVIRTVDENNSNSSKSQYLSFRKAHSPGQLLHQQCHLPRTNNI